MGHFCSVANGSAGSNTVGFPTLASLTLKGWYTGNRHPTEKPVEILRPLIETFSAPGDIVLDPFCGLGSTLEAAQSCGRAFLGVELDGEHFRTASSRMGLLS